MNTGGRLKTTVKKLKYKCGLFSIVTRKCVPINDETYLIKVLTFDVRFWHFKYYEH